MTSEKDISLELAHLGDPRFSKYSKGERDLPAKAETQFQFYIARAWILNLNENEPPLLLLEDRDNSGIFSFAFYKGDGFQRPFSVEKLGFTNEDIRKALTKIGK